MIKNTMIAALMLVFSVSVLMAANTEKKLEGTWEYKASEAPYEYSAGQLVFKQKDGKLEGVAKVNYGSMELEDLKVTGEKVSFTVYVEGEYVQINLTLKGDKLTGKAAYSEGSLDVSATKK